MLIITRTISEVLKDYRITHAGIKPFHHPELGVEVPGRTAVHYLRFGRTVRVDRLELPRYGGNARWAPQVPLHPAHLIVSVLDGERNCWKTVREVELPADPRTTGKGLSQQMSLDEMEAHFAAIYNDPPYVIDLGGIETDHLRVECDREHPVWPNYGEVNGGRYNVPFAMLEPMRAVGEALGELPAAPNYRPLLKVGTVRPEAPEGMKVVERPERVLFLGDRISVGFSLRRPLLLHLGWDALAEGRAKENRLLTARPPYHGATIAASGPMVRTLDLDCGPHLWTGEVEIAGNCVHYRNLGCGVEGILVEATFRIEPDRLIMELTQSCDRQLPVIEWEAWRLAWDLNKHATAAAAVPTLRPGRNGDVKLPVAWASDGNGCLSCRVVDGTEDQVNLQVESWRSQSVVTGGLSLGGRAEGAACQVVPAETLSATVELAVTNLQPDSPEGAPGAGPGIRRHWASVFSCFRPELGGFSNSALACNCHLAQYGPIEIAARTRRSVTGPDPLEMARFTVGQAMMDGCGYGYWRNLYLDSDPVLLSAAGRIYQVDPDLAWLRRIEPGLVASARRVLGTIGEEGLAICRDLSGNSGTHRWSSNAWDIIGFGHMDAYVNAWTYRGLRNAAAVLGLLDQGDLANRCRQAARGIRENYAKFLINPKTGWVAGWRSRDGQLHDYAMTFVNGSACAFGVLDEAVARKALEGLEALRDDLGMSSGRLGIPFSLLPLRPEDHRLHMHEGNGVTEPTFEFYTDGSTSPSSATYYLRALSICGLKDRALKLADDLDQALADGLFTGPGLSPRGRGSAVELLSWEGLAAGYEGTFCLTFGPLYGIAIEKGLLEPTRPEWWPDGG